MLDTTRAGLGKLRLAAAQAPDPPTRRLALGYVTNCRKAARLPHTLRGLRGGVLGVVASDVLRVV